MFLSSSLCDVWKMKLVIVLAASRSSALVPAEVAIHHRETESFAAPDLGLVVFHLGFVVLVLRFVVLFPGVVVLVLGFVVLGCFSKAWVT